MNENEKAIFVS